MVSTDAWIHEPKAFGIVPEVVLGWAACRQHPWVEQLCPSTALSVHPKMSYKYYNYQHEKTKEALEHHVEEHSQGYIFMHLGKVGCDGFMTSRKMGTVLELR